MMAPKYMRAMLLGEVMETALQELDAPIDSVEIGVGMARVKAAGRTRYFAFHLEHSTDGEGRPLLGSDRWVVTAAAAPAAPSRFFLGRWLMLLLGKG